MKSNYMLRIFSLLVLISMSGCGSEEVGLVGNWTSSEVQTEWGRVVFHYAFCKDGKLTVKSKYLDSGNNGEVVVSRGAYTIKSGVFSSPLINKARDVPYELRDGKLVFFVGGDEVVLTRSR